LKKHKGSPNDTPCLAWYRKDKEDRESFGKALKTNEWKFKRMVHESTKK
jgi:hypothetical protein